ncbi:hypothetical protein CF394_12845 [Tetzosporium hominis]|uniref:DUF1294 domain-containing protein n=2 Tax=Caryophanaceae TaxID=186818 RepID=A0A264W115_9BACL|nr:MULTISPECIES: DUF1294 domain-containing protein [Planococcaceae]OZS77253.1 hypothetical protein CF394_12845 [Tetzosporium hominis]PJK17419.1 DUF1294 domain-containing protein [Chryseomicrobium excrementi]
MDYLWIIVVVMSAIAFFTMRYDKNQARKGGQRVPENTLWLLALLGGGPGAYAGMQAFRHKTKHTQFRIGFLVLALLDLFLLVYLSN